RGQSRTRARRMKPGTPTKEASSHPAVVASGCLRREFVAKPQISRSGRSPVGREGALRGPVQGVPGCRGGTRRSSLTLLGVHARAERVLVDPEAANARFQRAGRHAERLRRALGAVHAAAALGERLLDLQALVAGGGARWARTLAAEAGKLEIAEAEHVAAGEDHRAL